MDTLCKTCKNRCKVTRYESGMKIGEICYIRFDAGGDADPVHMSSDGLCDYYETNLDKKDSTPILLTF